MEVGKTHFRSFVFDGDAYALVLAQTHEETKFVGDQLAVRDVIHKHLA